jgi:hypothetical protein
MLFGLSLTDLSSLSVLKRYSSRGINWLDPRPWPLLEVRRFKTSKAAPTSDHPPKGLRREGLRLGDTREAAASGEKAKIKVSVHYRISLWYGC